MKWHFFVWVLTIIWVSTQKDNVDWSSLNTIDEVKPWHIVFPSSLALHTRNFVLISRLFLWQVASHPWVYSYKMHGSTLQCCNHRFPLYKLWSIRELQVYAPVITLRQKLKLKTWLVKGSWFWNHNFPNSPNYHNPRNLSSSISINREEGQRLRETIWRERLC